MKSYGQYCPLTMAVEILGDRWTLLIVRELLFSARRFNELARGLPGVSRALLTRRLRQLERDGIVERRSDASGRQGAYGLTQAGLELQPLAQQLVAWGTRWAFKDPEPVHL